MTPTEFVESISSRGKPGDVIACITPMHSFHVLTWSYLEAARVLVRHIDKGGFFIDIAVHPICFLYRHSLELALKQIVWDGRRLLDEEGRIEKICRAHHLKPLWNEAERIMESIWPELPIPDEVMLLREIVGWFQECDPSSQAFRYPFNKDLQSTLSGKDRINLSTLVDSIETTRLFLDGLSGALSEYLSTESSSWF